MHLIQDYVIQFCTLERELQIPGSEEENSCLSPNDSISGEGKGQWEPGGVSMLVQESWVHSLMYVVLYG